MRVIFKDVSLIPDNDNNYFHLLESVINTKDELSTLEIRRNLNSYNFRIAVSAKEYLIGLIEELNNLHNLIGIKVDFSKSMKSTSSVSYKINL